ncbi:MAG: ABC transporter permease, partial [Planctomycetota bacterium]|nr:ABC transporter permease [Planctomycetota bacterium]
FGIQSMYMEHAVSCVFMDFSGVSKYFGTREAFLVQMGIAEDVTTIDEEQLANAVEAASPGAVFASGRAIRKEILRIGGVMLTVSTFVALGAMTLASLAAGGVIAAGIATRSFELGVLEAVGASRGLVSRLILSESLLIGITAGITGSVFGIYLAWMGTRCYRDMAGLELSLKIPIDVVLGGFVAASVAAILAAAPAVRSLTRRSPRELLGGAKG